MKSNLIIIGNGFDVWQGLETSYSKFKDYYYEHRKSIASIKYPVCVFNYKSKTAPQESGAV